MAGGDTSGAHAPQPPRASAPLPNEAASPRVWHAPHIIAPQQPLAWSRSRVAAVSSPTAAPPQPSSPPARPQLAQSTRAQPNAPRSSGPAAAREIAAAIVPAREIVAAREITAADLESTFAMDSAAASASSPATAQNERLALVVVGIAAAPPPPPSGTVKSRLAGHCRQNWGVRPKNWEVRCHRSDMPCTFQ